MKSAPALQYSILGPLRILDGGRPLALTAKKHRLLLVRLVLAANSVVSTDELIESLWGTRLPGTAQKLVQVYVSQLRKSLGEAAVETHPTGYLLRVEPGALDAAVFEELVREGREAAAAGNAVLARSRFARALALWRGRALADAAYDDFALAEANRLEELRLAALEERLHADVVAGEGAEVLEELQTLIASHPLREGLRASLMLALYRAGRQAEALAVYRAAQRILADELGLAPGPRLRALERAILEHDPALDASTESQTPRRLPVAATALIGRERELGALQALVGQPSTRLVTLAGAGGSGKSRLALELANRAQGSFANGVFLVELAPVQDGDHVPTTLLLALELSSQPGTPPIETLAAWLAEREVLLVLDNVEHLVDAVRELIAILSQAPSLTIVVTSRRVLHVTGEHIFPVAPLDDDDAVALFSARVAAVSPGLEEQAATQQIALDICHRLDNLPLAIELAAARTPALTLDELLDRLDDRLSLLVDGPRDLPARQRTLHETLAWSTDLLDDDERQGFARLGVFPGGATIRAAHAVCGLDLPQLQALVSDSLVNRVALHGEARFVLLETVREHALRLLGPGRPEVELAHARYFADLAEEHLEYTISPRWSDGAQQAKWLDTLDAELDNLRAALERATDDPDPDTSLRLAAGLWRYWYVRGLLVEGLAVTRRALDLGATGDARLRAYAAFGAAGIAWALGDLDLSTELAEMSLSLGRSDAWIEIGATNQLGLIALHRNDHATARVHIERARAAAEAIDLEVQAIVATHNLGSIAFAEGKLTEAVSLWETVLAYHLRNDGDEGVGLASINIGLAALRLGDIPRARSAFEESHRRFTAIAFREHIGHAELGLAAVSLAEGDQYTAARLLGAALAIFDETQSTPEAFEAELAQQVEHDLRAQLGDAELDDVLARPRHASR